MLISVVYQKLSICLIAFNLMNILEDMLLICYTKWDFGSFTLNAIIYVSFFPCCECSALLLLKCRSRWGTLCSQCWNVSLDPSGFRSDSLLFLLCVAKYGQWKSPAPSCRAWAVLQARPKMH